MSTLFDYAFNNAVAENIDSLAATIMLMTDDDSMFGNPYWGLNDGTYIHWELMTRKCLAAIMHHELMCSENEQRPASLTNVLECLRQEDTTFDAAAATFDRWPVVPAGTKSAVRSELHTRIGLICSVADFTDLLETRAATGTPSTSAPRSPYRYPESDEHSASDERSVSDEQSSWTI